MLDILGILVNMLFYLPYYFCTILLTLREFHRPTFKQAWGFGLTRLGVTTKAKNDSHALFIGKVFVNPCLFFRRRGWWHLLLWNPWTLEQFCCWNLSKRWQYRTTCVPGEATIGPRGYPQEVPKNRSRNKRGGPGQFRANGFKMEAQIWKFGVLLVLYFSSKTVQRK